MSVRLPESLEIRDPLDRADVQWEMIARRSIISQRAIARSYPRAKVIGHRLRAACHGRGHLEPGATARSAACSPCEAPGIKDAARSHGSRR